MIGGFRSNLMEETIFLKHSYFHVDEHSFYGLQHYWWAVMSNGGRSKYQAEPYGLSGKIHST